MKSKFNCTSANLYLIVFTLLLFTACQKAEVFNPKDHTSNSFKELNDLSINDQTIDRQLFNSYCSNYQSLSRGKRNTILQTSYKEMAYQLADNQKENFFNDLLAEPASRIVISWGLKNLSAKSLLPIVGINRPDGSFSKNFYPLENIPYQKEANPSSCLEGRDKCGQIISVGCAAYLENAWFDISKEHIEEYFYHEEELIKYYTYGTTVTASIQEYLKTENASAPFLKLHLGALPNEDTGKKTAKMVIQVWEGKSKDFEHLSVCNNQSEYEGSGYFEFAKPCPSYCPWNIPN